MRDPFISRGEDGKFYVIATDMKSSEGWASQSSIVVYNQMTSSIFMMARL